METTYDSIQPGMVAILGIPSDENSSFLRGPAQAPAAIRQTLYSGSSNWCTEDGLDLEAEPRLVDEGDLKLSPGETGTQIESAVARLLQHGARVLSLGGDHAVTYPILKAYGKQFQDLSILHIDAHPDLYDELDGNRCSHACPFARIMEAGLAKRLVQVGIRTLNPHQRRQASRFGVEMVEMRAWPPAAPLEFNGPTYLSLDLDALDPAYAPGVSHHAPGGFTTREVLNLIQGLRAPLVGADIVELNPVRDLAGITAAAAVKFLKEIAARLLDL